MDLEQALSKLAESQVDRERLSRELADLRTAAGQLGTVSQERDALKGQVGDLTGQLNAALQAATDLTGQRDTAVGQVTVLVGKYRESRLSGDHTLTPVADLVTGGTPEEIDASIEKARALVTSVQEAVRAGGQVRPVPNGGTERQPPNTDGMSAGELIRAGIAQQAAAGR